MIELNKIYNEDCLLTMKKMDSESVDMVLTSPPYDNLRNYNGYAFDFENIAKELFRITKNSGVVVWVVGDATINGSETGTSFKQALYFKDIGFNLHDTMIYAKENPIPLTHNRYEQSFEYMFVLSKGKPKTFNPLKDKCVTNGRYTNRRNTGRVAESATRNRNEESYVKTDKFKVNMWYYSIGNNKDNTKHPAPFPEQLAFDQIKTWSNENDIVFDPFMGSGTTAKISIMLKRNYLGSEISKEYFDLINRRINNFNSQPYLF